jgi:thiol-disulfide isomerase/thioredoxin
LNLRTAKPIECAIGLLFAVVASLRTSLSVTAATILRQKLWKVCIMSKIDVEYDLDEALEAKPRVFVLFYASWCPFSQKFLPIFEKYARENPENCLRIKTDDKAKLCEKYSVDVVPTVLLFEKGRVTRRLDGAPGAGLNEKQLKKLDER